MIGERTASAERRPWFETDTLLAGSLATSVAGLERRMSDPRPLSSPNLSTLKIEWLAAQNPYEDWVATGLGLSWTRRAQAGPKEAKYPQISAELAGNRHRWARRQLLRAWVPAHR